MIKSSINTVVFITGAFISHHCWDEWIVYFESEGYSCMAPSWPHKNAPSEELRNRTAKDLMAFNTMTAVTDYFADIIRSLPEKPILIGHSAGGLIVQLLLQRELAVAGVALHSFPPRGVSWFRFSLLNAIEAALILVSPGYEIHLLSFRKWKYRIANGMTCEQQKQTYYRYAVPESKRVIRELFACSVKINFRQYHAPLLFTSGSSDQLIPASVNYGNYRKYSTSHSITDYREFKDHNHLIFSGTAWCEEADFILYWLEGINQ